jgi:hypothetical protein
MMKYVGFILSLFLIATSASAQTTAGLAVVWEADTYTPPNYPGKALPSAGSTITVTVLPYGPNVSGLPLAAADFTYTWTKDGLSLPSSSGAGKNSLSFTAASAGSNTISVQAENKANKLVLEQQILIPITAPQVLLYEYDPLWGTLQNHTLPSVYQLIKKELSVAAVPYFISTNATRASEVEYSWQLNGKPIITNTTEPELATFVRPDDALEGSNEISLNLRNTINPLQIAHNALKITFAQ